VTGVLTTIWYTAFFSSLSFLKGPMRLDTVQTEIVVGISAAFSMVFYVLVGKWSDRVGRKLPLVIGAAATLVLLFPLFWAMGSMANPGLKASAAAAPVVVTGEACSTDPFADLFGRKQSDCGKLLETLSASGVPYTVKEQPALMLTVGGNPVPLDAAWLKDGKARKQGVETALAARGFDFSCKSRASVR
jgi:MFS family permease